MKMMELIKTALEKFELWFNNKFGWFFTNGMKQMEEERSIPN